MATLSSGPSKRAGTLIGRPPCLGSRPRLKLPAPLPTCHSPSFPRTCRVHKGSPRWGWKTRGSRLGHASTFSGRRHARSALPTRFSPRPSLLLAGGEGRGLRFSATIGSLPAIPRTFSPLSPSARLPSPSAARHLPPLPRPSPPPPPLPLSPAQEWLLPPPLHRLLLAIRTSNRDPSHPPHRPCHRRPPDQALRTPDQTLFTALVSPCLSSPPTPANSDHPNRPILLTRPGHPDRGPLHARALTSKSISR